MLNVNPIADNFESVVGNATAIKPISDSDLVDLQELLNKHTSPDYYQSSATYFGMTGRDGLYKIERNGSTVIISGHPNLENTFLLFPVIGKNNEELLYTTMQALRKTGVNIQFARFETPPFLNGFSRSVVGTQETTLDWAYPVHTLSTSLVSEHKGGGFQHFRQKHNKLKGKKISAVDLDPRKHSEEIASILQKWSPDEKQDVYFRLLDMFDYAPLAGRIIYVDGEPVGFSIFEKTNPEKGIANAFAHIGLHEVTGASQHVMLDMCQSLLKDGFEKVCIGGSEDEGLDRFKRNLCPIESVSLQSWIPIIQRGVRLDQRFTAV